MTSHYFSVTLLPDADLDSHFLMSKVFAKLHRALVTLPEPGSIGISFPEYGKQLGNVIRLHGSEAALAALESTPWMRGLRDCTETSAVTPTPTEILGYGVVYRQQSKSSPERILRRKVRLGQRTTAQAEAALETMTPKLLKLPFVPVSSSSTGQDFLLFIKQQKVKVAKEGAFNAYGLTRVGLSDASDQGCFGVTVPLF